MLNYEWRKWREKTNDKFKYKKQEFNIKNGWNPLFCTHTYIYIYIYTFVVLKQQKFYAMFMSLYKNILRREIPQGNGSSVWRSKRDGEILHLSGGGRGKSKNFSHPLQTYA